MIRGTLDNSDIVRKLHEILQFAKGFTEFRIEIPVYDVWQSFKVKDIRFSLQSYYPNFPQLQTQEGFWIEMTPVTRLVAVGTNKRYQVCCWDERGWISLVDFDPDASSKQLIYVPYTADQIQVGNFTQIEGHTYVVSSVHHDTEKGYDRWMVSCIRLNPKAELNYRAFQTIEPGATLPHYYEHVI